MTDKDLMLRHKGTDPAGAEVYDAYAMDDRLELKTVLFEVKLTPSAESTAAEITPCRPGVNRHGTG